MGRDRLEFFALLIYRTHLPRTLPATQSRMRKEFKRGKPSSFCPFRTFRTGEKYLILHVLLHDQKYQKSSKRFPLRNLPVLSRFAKARPAPFPLSAHRLHARPPLLYMRAWNQRIRESARLLRVMCSHAWYRESCVGETELSFFTLIAARTHLPRNIPCDSVAYAEGVQKRNAFLFLSFSYFSGRRKVLCASCTFA